MLHQQGRIGDARKLYERIVELEPRHAAAWNLLGITALQAGDAAGAVPLFRRSIESEPRDAAVHVNCGTAHSMLGQHEAAIACFEQAIAIDPDSNASPFYNRGTSLQQLGRHAEALASYDAAIALESDLDANAYYGRAQALLALHRPGEALESFDRAIALGTGYLAQAHHDRGGALAELGRHEDALGSYAAAIAAAPLQVSYRKSRAALLFRLGRRIEALEAFDAIVEQAPDDFEALHDHGVALAGLTRYADAVASFDRAIALKPDFAAAYDSRGLALTVLGRHEVALESLERALALNPGLASAHFNRGNVLASMKRTPEALDSYARALALNPDLPYLSGQMLLSRLAVCDWTQLQPALACVVEAIGRGAAACAPFGLLGLPVTPEVQRRGAEIWVRDHCPPRDFLPPLQHRGRGGRIRLGYFSADFHDHATAYLIAELFELHDRARFEVLAFSFGPPSDGAMRRRLAAGCDRFIEARGQSDLQLARTAREFGVDIAVDLKGFTQDSRPRIFALRAAALQVSYLGYPGTLSAPYMDYLIADRVVVTPQSRPHYSEQLAYLPHSYQVNDSRRAIAERTITRAAADLPGDGFVFCCFNNAYKILPEAFGTWMRILARVPGSVLWLIEDSRLAAENLRRAAAERGIDPRRLVFAPRLTLPRHLARHALADLFLDTWPYNAHTTASDALWAGLPVLTLAGETFAARVGASLLTAMELPQLITSSPGQFEELAVALAADPRRLGELRRHLIERRLTAPLFDTRRYARDIEGLFAAMHERHLAGLPPADLP